MIIHLNDDDEPFCHHGNTHVKTLYIHASLSQCSRHYSVLNSIHLSAVERFLCHPQIKTEVTTWSLTCAQTFPHIMSSSKCFFHQLLRGVTISNGGVLPRIHPELLSKKRGGRVKVDSQASVTDKQEERLKSKKPTKTFKKVKGKRGRKPKVSAPISDDDESLTLLLLTAVCSVCVCSIKPELVSCTRERSFGNLNADLSERFSLHVAKSTDNDKEAVSNSTVEDGPGDGFTILSAKSLFLGQKVSRVKV